MTLAEAAPVVRQTASTAAICAAGAALGLLLHVPGGHILGAMVAAAFAASKGQEVRWRPGVYTVIAALLGVASGASLTPQTLGLAAAWPVSILLLFLSSVLMCACGYFALSLFGVNRQTAFFAVAPGALTTVLLLAEENKADMATVGLVQTLRMVVLLLLAPIAIGGAMHGAAPAVAAHAGAGGSAPLEWAMLAAAAAAGMVLARRLRWPTPDLLGPMAASALLHVLGVVSVAAPHWMTLAVGACMGVTVGERLGGLTFSQFRRILILAVTVLVLMGAIGALGGVIAGHVAGVGPLAGILAFAPGSLDAIIALALAFNAQPAYVAVHHLARFVMLMLILPVVSRFLFPKVADDGPEPERV